MPDLYYTVNLRAYLDKDEPTYIGEGRLCNLLSEFSCPQNPDVEHFLLHNAVNFTKKDQSVTYLVFRADNALLAGYFSLAIKPISINAGIISKTMARKLSRVSLLNEASGSYTTAAYLIAQLGKNYALSRDQRIDGSVLLDFALETIERLKYSIGGVIEFLECENSDFLMDFYTRNKFKFFDTRSATTSIHHQNPYRLNQLLKFI